jgi:hypothetical protein
MSPNVNIIAGLSSTGKVYLSLTTVNTDSDVMMLFVGWLCKTLIRENPKYRETTVFLLDGASYHRSKETRTYFDRLGLKLMLSAAYSYSGAVAEMLFAYFKKVELNPAGYKTGKTNFKAVGRMVYDRILQMPRHSFLLFWHSAILHQFEYLNFKRL